MNKTNAMRLLDAAKIAYETREYAPDEENLSGVHVASQIGIPAERVFKTLVAVGDKHGAAVFCIPCAEELDLKKAAKLTGDKKIELLHVRDLLQETGYIRGGCSPIGMKKKFPTFIHSTAENYDTVTISAGVRGCQLLVAPTQLIAYTGARVAELV